MNALEKDEDTRHVFDYGIMGLFPKNDNNPKNLFQIALDDKDFKMQPLNEILKDGLDLFEKMFGYRSSTFIAPCFTWPPNIEKTLFEKGVIGLQGKLYQHSPGEKPIRHFLGTRNKWGQIYTIRNASFEPTQGYGKDDCIYRIKCAFRWHKPAIISAHRINFIGAINEENRNKNLKNLDSLLGEVFKLWPDVEFMTSDQLVEIIKSDNK
jgi:hypothetical protein